MDELLSPLVSMTAGTCVTLIFGEILPQVICMKYGLAIGSAMSSVAKFIMYVTYLVCQPLAWTLDKCTRKKEEPIDTKKVIGLLRKTLQNNPELHEGSLRIVSGAIEMQHKLVQSSMHFIEDAYMLSSARIIDRELIVELLGHGFSRVPVYTKEDRSSVHSIIILKELLLVDQSAKTTVQSHIDAHPHPLITMYEDSTLLDALRTLRKGHHMALLIRRPDCTPVGIITIEDLIEECLQDNITDETDVHRQEKKKKKKPQGTPFLEENPLMEEFSAISPSSTLAAFAP